MPLPTIPSGNVASATASTGFEIANSVRLAGDAYFNRTCSNAYYDEVTFNFWVKRSTLGTDQGLFGRKGTNSTAHGTFCHFTTDDALLINFRDSGGTSQYYIITTKKFRDVSAWYNIHIRVDGLDGTQNDRIQLWVNGVRETVFDLFSAPSSTGYQIATFLTNGSQDFTVGRSLRSQNDTFYNFNGYMAEFHCCTGQHYACTEFGEFDSDSPRIWKPKETSGLSYGNDGFYLDFEDSGDLDDDESGEGHDFTSNSLAATDQAVDSPTNNFCTLNPLFLNSGLTFSEGNLNVVASDANYRHAVSSMAVQSGKWYAEFKAVSGFSSVDKNVGIYRTDNAYSATTGLGNYTSGTTWAYGATGNVRTSNGNNDTGEATFTDGDIISIAMDLDNNKLYFAKNNSWINSGDPESGSTGTGAYAIVAGDFYHFAVTTISSGGAALWSCNFGSPSYANSSDAADANGYGAFEYAPPSGYLALCTKNLGSDGG